MDTKKIGAGVFGEFWNVVLEENWEDKWPEKVTNEDVLERIGEKKTLLSNILDRKINWISHILKRNCLFIVHWRMDYRSERTRKVKNTAPWWFEKQKKILRAKGGRWRSKKMVTTVYELNIRKKYTFSSISPWICE